jgi:hypothetical protein
MKILITGVTETHNNHPQRASSTKFVSIPELMRDAYIAQGHDVEHGPVNETMDLSKYDKVFLYVYPLDKNAVHPEGAKRVLRERMDAYICLDDWAFQKIIPSWEDVIAAEDFADHQWIAPLFPWGNHKLMNLPVDVIHAWDPSPLYEMPPSYQMAWGKRKNEWYNASLSKDAHDWATAQNLTWPIHSVGGKSLGQPRILESDVVWQYGAYKGILCPTYAHAGCGWWRVRYLHAASTGAVLGGDPQELGIIDSSYSYTPRELERMDDAQLQIIAAQQYVALTSQIATLKQTQLKLESFLT